MLAGLGCVQPSHRASTLLPALLPVPCPARVAAGTGWGQPADRLAPQRLRLPDRADRSMMEEAEGRDNARVRSTVGNGWVGDW